MTLRTIHLAGTTRDWQLCIPDLGILSGRFQILGMNNFVLNQDGMIFNLGLDSVDGLKFEAGQ